MRKQQDFRLLKTRRHAHYGPCAAHVFIRPWLAFGAVNWPESPSLDIAEVSPKHRTIAPWLPQANQSSSTADLRPRAGIALEGAQ